MSMNMTSIISDYLNNEGIQMADIRKIRKLAQKIWGTWHLVGIQTPNGDYVLDWKSGLMVWLEILPLIF